MTVAMLFNIVAVLCFFASGSADWWNYDDTSYLGPSDWGSEILTCDGTQQSPIDINTASASFLSTLPTFTFTDFDNTGAGAHTIINNGHSVVVVADGLPVPEVSGADLKGPYIVSHYHFHWGSMDARGSEHTIDGVRSPLEMHIVMLDKNLNSIGEALNGKKDTLAVLSVMFQISDNDNPNLASLVTAIKDITAYESRTKSSAMPNLIDMLPSNTQNFYRYYGSLTTPTCDEIVVWTVFDTKVDISSAQMAAFRTLMNAEEENLQDNFRPTQALNGRPIYKSFR